MPLHLEPFCFIVVFTSRCLLPLARAGHRAHYVCGSIGVLGNCTSFSTTTADPNDFYFPPKICRYVVGVAFNSDKHI